MTNLLITNGDNEIIDIAVHDVDGQAFNLTGCDLLFTAKTYTADSDDNAIVRKTVGDGIAIASPPSLGLATVALSPSDTTSFPNIGPRYYYYWDLRLTTSTGGIITVASGILRVSETIGTP